MDANVNIISELYDTDTSTPVIIEENYIIECNHMCLCRTPSTPLIRSVSATNVN